MRDGQLTFLSVRPALFCSSARAELLALNFVAHIAIPIQIALDNLGVVSFAQRIVEWCGHTSLPRPGKPLFLFSDGDLWAAFYQAIRARGPHSICVTKTVGHGNEKRNLTTHEYINQKTKNESRVWSVLLYP